MCSDGRCCCEGKAHRRFFFSATRVMNACSRGVRDASLSPPTCTFSSVWLTGGADSPGGKSENQTSAMETPLRLRCVCVLALVILKGKVMCKKLLFFFYLTSESCWAAARRRENVTSAQNKLETMLLMLVSNSETKNGNLFPRVVHEHFEGPFAPQRWGEKALNRTEKFPAGFSILCCIHFDRCSWICILTKKERVGGDEKGN